MISSRLHAFRYKVFSFNEPYCRKFKLIDANIGLWIKILREKKKAIEKKTEKQK